MIAVRKTLWLGLIALFAASCSVISHPVKKEAEPSVPFKSLLQEASRYEGRTVILGGYILETVNLADETRITVVQAPLTLRDRPKSADYSEGRFIVLYSGFLDPEVYRKDRQLTVAGNVVSRMLAKIGECERPYLKIESREIYLWPQDDYYYVPPYRPHYYYYHGFWHHRFHPYW